MSSRFNASISDPAKTITTSISIFGNSIPLLTVFAANRGLNYETISPCASSSRYHLSSARYLPSHTRAFPPEVRFKSGYVNPVPKPPDFTSAMLWGIAIADTREPGFQNATIEIAHAQLICRADGRDVVLNE